MDKSWKGTTVVGLRHRGDVVIAADGQVSLGATIIKATAQKIRRLRGGVLVGFAGSTADAFTLVERLESKLEAFPSQLKRAAVELAKDWRTDRFLRRLEAMLIVADAKSLLVLTGQGDVLEPDENLAAIGSGGSFALAAARALVRHSDLDAEAIAREALKVAGEICIYTNSAIKLEKLSLGKET